MNLVDREALLVVGHAVRTTNAAEADPQRAQLGHLWERVASETWERVQGRVGGSLYAVLTDYESDHHGAYTQVVGVAVASLDGLPEGLVAVRVPAARCLELEARGPMPQALIQAWQAIWRHTESGATPPRAFTTDLEVHRDDGADIYLAIRSE
jgi:predicted transcriptional regulator YdeE